MGKLGGIILVSVLALTGCASAPPAPVERAAEVRPAVSVQSGMIAELRPALKSLNASDSELMTEAYRACITLLFRSKDSYRETALAQYQDMTLGLDHLTVAAAAKRYLCP
jgi:hypothetical protein